MTRNNLKHNKKVKCDGRTNGFSNVESRARDLKNKEDFQNCVSFNEKERCMVTNLVMKVKNAEHVTRFTI